MSASGPLLIGQLVEDQTPPTAQAPPDLYQCRSGGQMHL